MANGVAITVNLERCTHCGFCAEVCPSRIIRLTSDGPELVWAKACISCGHCVAVCPQDAMDHTRNPLANQMDVSQVPGLDAETAERFLRTRRSIRVYTKDKVSPELLRRLLNIGRFAPTGGNSQGTSYLVISDADVLKKITAFVIDWLEEQIKQDIAWAKPYAGMAKIYRDTGYDVVLRNAPHLVMALGDVRNPISRDNGRYALTYVELYAPSLGLGSCWAGFFEMALFAKHQPLIEVLDIPEGKAIAGALMLGVPKHRYQRLVDRNPLDVTIR